MITKPVQDLSEAEVYAELYRRQAAGDPTFENYGHEVHAGAVGIELVANNAKRAGWRVLDVGCGHNGFVKALRERGVEAFGTDAACPSADALSTIEALDPSLLVGGRRWLTSQDGKRQFLLPCDLLTAFDVLEHIPEQDLNTTFLVMRRIAPYFMFTVGMGESSFRLDGRTLHPTVHDLKWWLSRIQRAGAARIETDRHLILGQWKE